MGRRGVVSLENHYNPRHTGMAVYATKRARQKACALFRKPVVRKVMKTKYKSGLFKDCLVRVTLTLLLT